MKFPYKSRSLPCPAHYKICGQASSRRGQDQPIAQLARRVQYNPSHSTSSCNSRTYVIKKCSWSTTAPFKKVRKKRRTCSFHAVGRHTAHKVTKSHLLGVPFPSAPRLHSNDLGILAVNLALISVLAKARTQRFHL